jgi:hypothetical protein
MPTILLTRNETEADKEWTNCAVRNRYDVKIYSYNNLNSLVFMRYLKGGSTNIEVALHDQGYKNYLMRACNNIGVDYPDDKDCSFKRDYYLIRDADSLYFSGYFDTNGKSRLHIKGRESWIVEMFVNKLLEIRKLEEQKAIKAKEKPKTYNPQVPIFMFSEDMKCWCQLNISTMNWMHIIRAPKPIGKYLAFGSHPVSDKARTEFSLI